MPLPLKMASMHFSIRERRVADCLAWEKCSKYPRCLPGVRFSNAAFNSGSSLNLFFNSSGMGYSEVFLASTFAPDFSSSVASQMYVSIDFFALRMSFVFLNRSCLPEFEFSVG